MKKTHWAGIIILIVLILILIQYSRFKKCISQVNTNCKTNPNCISDCGELITNVNGTNQVAISKFPFYTTVTIGSVNNK